MQRPKALLFALYLKRAHNCSAWTLSDPSRTLFERFEGSLTAAALNAIARTLFFFGEDGVEGVSVLEVGVLIAAFEPGLALYGGSVGEGVWDDSAIGFFL